MRKGRIGIGVAGLFIPIVSLLLIACHSSKDTKTLNVDDDGWLFAHDSSNVGINQRWYTDSSDKSQWVFTKSGYWSDVDGQIYQGAAWYATQFDIQDSAQQYSVFFGGVDDDADIWVNGQKVGAHAGYDEPFSFDVTGLHCGHNNLVVRIVNRGGPGGLHKPVQIVRSSEVRKLFKSKFADRNARPSAEWVRDAVIYEVYLRSFSKAGTFKGLETRLPELKSLGVSVLWLMPIHPVGELGRKGRLGSPYSVQDYYGINPEFGTLDEFNSLVASVHRLGMKIIIDLVANHTSWDSKLLFEHPEWFKTNGEGAIVSPNADWTDVAQLDYRQHELRKYMINMMEYWVRDIGIDGFRCDVADMLPLDFWETARSELNKIKPVMMLAEGKKPEDHLSAFDLTYSWNLYDILGDVVDGGRTVNVFDKILDREILEYPRNSLRLRFNTNHDKNVKDAPAIRKYTSRGAKATIALIFTYPGVPLIYNGEEVGNTRTLDLFDKVNIDWSKKSTFRDLYTELARMRVEHPALRDGQYRRIWCSDSSRVYAFERKAGHDDVYVVINFSNERKIVKANIAHNCFDFLGGKTFVPEKGKVSLSLPPFGFLILGPDGRKDKQ